MTKDVARAAQVQANALQISTKPAAGSNDNERGRAYSPSAERELLLRALVLGAIIRTIPGGSGINWMTIHIVSTARHTNQPEIRVGPLIAAKKRARAATIAVPS